MISVPLPHAYGFASFGARSGCANETDDRVEIVERDLVAFEDMLALAEAAQHEDRTALHDVDAVIDEGTDGFVERAPSVGR